MYNAVRAGSSAAATDERHGVASVTPDCDVVSGEAGSDVVPVAVSDQGAWQCDITALHLTPPPGQPYLSPVHT